VKVPRLFVDNETPVVEQQLTLSKEASKYLTRVLRRKAGDELVIFNGDGNNYAATLTSVSSQSEVTITNCHTNPTESPLHITLVQSLAKGSKLDLVIQKATELGVNRITPISAERSVMQIDEQRLQKRLQHWRGIAVSACTQCGRSVVPTIDAPVETGKWLSGNSAATLMLHPGGTQSISDITITDSQCQILIGPEGGFSDSEVALATSANIQLVSCGPRILRTETAGFTALSILQSRYGDL
jgi:16S rRNA (uracil1498-N3)-methyltransferase